ncbi:SPX-domain-containing protein [Leucogyrophana mollusca]|uniref:SPX-domain-containing protein n=1 Tax=Leucogyrophana mollusca TaxID=85980 RepID=A0ACB8BCR0_9AGAM|nr:SPX-domain-containing protein [Leucogyrophana mollusca]
MKFARYLQDTQTPEWKRAYIDYRGLKKKIGAIRAQQLQLEAANSTATTDVDRAHPAKDFASQPSNLPALSERGATTSRSRPPTGNTNDNANANVNPDEIQAPGAIRKRNSRRRPSLTLKLVPVLHSNSTNTHRQGSTSTPAAPHTPHSPPVFPFFRDLGDPTHPTPPLHVLLPLLPPLHADFFAFLDAELEKIDSFYAEREREMADRGRRLHEQLAELRDHRKVFYESAANATLPTWANKAHLSLPAALLALTQQPAAITDKADPQGQRKPVNANGKVVDTNGKSLDTNGKLVDSSARKSVDADGKRLGTSNGKAAGPAQRRSRLSALGLSSDTASDGEDTDGGDLSSPSSPGKTFLQLDSGRTLVQPNSGKLTSTFKHGTGADAKYTGGAVTSSPKHASGTVSPNRASGPSSPKNASGTVTPKFASGTTTPKHAAGTATPRHIPGASTPPKHDPQEYQHAKKKLKKAVVEYYRGLEVLNNYRILNLTGFRKALKKYEKLTKVPAQQAYMRDKVRRGLL